MRLLRRVIENAEAAAEKWLAEFGLPAPDPAHPKDLRGRLVKVCGFGNDEESLRFFFPRRKIEFHQNVVKKVVRMLKKRGAEIRRPPVTPEDYARWLELQEDKTDTPSRRYDYATRFPGE